GPGHDAGSDGNEVGGRELRMSAEPLHGVTTAAATVEHDLVKARREVRHPVASTLGDRGRREPAEQAELAQALRDRADAYAVKPVAGGVGDDAADRAAWLHDGVDVGGRLAAGEPDQIHRLRVSLVGVGLRGQAAGVAAAAREPDGVGPWRNPDD